MQVETDFTSGLHTLAFEKSKMRINLTKEEGDEFEAWFNRKLKEDK
ncbi:hypothetical protein LCGC14_1059660 [marine sediment metagenome]|uniref:Uncharacterized protein n=1 Tax=marine sediment metagenome TaxID=412755 RepID=A0A0F9MR57_9ZZZZ